MNLKTRQELVKLLPLPKAIGVELGVAEGSFSDQLLSSHPGLLLYSIDAWDDQERGHYDHEHGKVLERLSKYGKRSVVIRRYFDKALSLFPDGLFDFIYIDGYAHTGQEGGKTMEQWYAKLKKGGVFAGHDYDPKEWPLTVASVDRFAAENWKHVYVIDKPPTGERFDNSYSWWLIK